jgi:hypothetical protein
MSDENYNENPSESESEGVSSLLEAQVQKLIDDVNTLQSDNDNLQLQVDRANAHECTWPEDIIYIPPPLNFSCSVSGNQASVLGGYWRIQGVGEGYSNAGTLTAPTGTQATPVLTLTLSQPVEFICVQNSFGASIPTPVITVIHANRPLANDGGLHTVILARAVSSDNTNWSIVEWGWPGGDIYESAPLPLGP